MKFCSMIFLFDVGCNCIFECVVEKLQFFILKKSFVLSCLFSPYSRLQASRYKSGVYLTQCVASMLQLRYKMYSATNHKCVLYQIQLPKNRTRDFWELDFEDIFETLPAAYCSVIRLSVLLLNCFNKYSGSSIQILFVKIYILLWITSGAK